MKPESIENVTSRNECSGEIRKFGCSYCTWYVPIATVNALGCMLFSCQTRFMRQGVVRKILRFMAFAIPYLFDTLPLLYRFAGRQFNSVSVSMYPAHTKSLVSRFTSACEPLFCPVHDISRLAADCCTARTRPRSPTRTTRARWRSRRSAPSSTCRTCPSAGSQARSTSSDTRTR